jgi:hypothetical protein
MKRSRPIRAFSATPHDGQCSCRTLAEDPSRSQPRAAFPRRCSSNASGLHGRNSARTGESLRAFKGIICDDISEFESHMPSHAVWSLWARQASWIELRFNARSRDIYGRMSREPRSLTLTHRQLWKQCLLPVTCVIGRHHLYELVIFTRTRGTGGRCGEQTERHEIFLWSNGPSWPGGRSARN